MQVRQVGLLQEILRVLPEREEVWFVVRVPELLKWKTQERGSAQDRALGPSGQVGTRGGKEREAIRQ